MAYFTIITFIYQCCLLFKCTRIIWNFQISCLCWPHLRDHCKKTVCLCRYIEIKILHFLISVMALAPKSSFVSKRKHKHLLLLSLYLRCSTDFTISSQFKLVKNGQLISWTKCRVTRPELAIIALLQQHYNSKGESAIKIVFTSYIPAP